VKFSVRLLYLYLFAFVGLLIVVIGSVNLVNLGIKTFIFPEADRYVQYAQPRMEGMSEINEEEMARQQETEQKRQRQRELSNSLSMIIVGVPLYLYHWKTIQKESHKK